ncbi:hypothetical protein [Burkholderia gladioli]|uniref:Uncharacterized protein n=1 Tax=Burkholderia gladioli TaxID=28095 RepID=A0A2A7SEJ8_BURGA|nr:hypothetical protein [Burkholderia gladioli]ATF89920.1 hypothetical protein CO712_34205 [Burkholderia gladioli pv. gladioli]MBU9214166.1 hypothetical protein [Burkholderia gladioli]MDN7724647.1 hypothetical protein [Burkholderia gladioli]MDN7804418.1 hypothetical protein [Burkholderia gladioli]MDR8092531.1 hypothetical protein [Burkholderia gladioli]
MATLPQASACTTCRSRLPWRPTRCWFKCDTLISVLDALASDGIRQPVAAVYPITRLKEALAHAVNGGKVLLAFESAMAPLS